MKKVEINIRKSIYLLFSLFISVYLASPKDILAEIDRENYLTYAHSSWIIMQRYIADGGVAILSNEPLFLLINIVLGSILNPEDVIRAIIFLSSMLVLYCLGKMTNFNLFVILFFLLIPQVIKNHVIHLRQGLGLGVYLLSFVAIKGEKRRIFKFLAAFIHSSFLFLLLLEFLDKLLKKMKLKFVPRIIFATIILTLFIQSLPLLATVLQDRRADVYLFSMANNSTGLGLAIWLIFASIFILVVNKKVNYNILACYGLVFYISGYFFLDFGGRIFENILPFIIVAVLNLEDVYAKRVLILFLGVYGIITM